MGMRRRRRRLAKIRRTILTAVCRAGWSRNSGELHKTSDGYLFVFYTNDYQKELIRAWVPGLAELVNTPYPALKDYLKEN